MNMLSSRPSEVGVYNGETDTNLKTNGQDVMHERSRFLCSLLIYRTKKAETRNNLLFRSVRFHDRAYDGNVDVLGADIMRRRYHCNVNIFHAM